MRDLCFIDCETTGLEDDADIWEFAGIRRKPDGAESRVCIQISHDVRKAETLPQPFRDDLAARFDREKAYRQPGAAHIIYGFFAPGSDGLAPQVVGAVPSFDTAMVMRLLRRNISPTPAPPWHHRLRCVESITVGHLGREIGGLQNCLEALGLPHGGDADAHTAMGDALSARAIWDAVMS